MIRSAIPFNSISLRPNKQSIWTNNFVCSHHIQNLSLPYIMHTSAHTNKLWSVLQPATDYNISILPYHTRISCFHQSTDCLNEVTSSSIAVSVKCKLSGCPKAAKFLFWQLGSWNVIAVAHLFRIPNHANAIHVKTVGTDHINCHSSYFQLQTWTGKLEQTPDPP